MTHHRHSAVEFAVMHNGSYYLPNPPFHRLNCYARTEVCVDPVTDARLPAREFPEQCKRCSWAARNASKRRGRRPENDAAALRCGPLPLLLGLALQQRKINPRKVTVGTPNRCTSGQTTEVASIGGLFISERVASAMSLFGHRVALVGRR